MRIWAAAAVSLLAPLASIACVGGGAGAAEDFLRMLPGRTDRAVYLDAAALRDDRSLYALGDSIGRILEVDGLSSEYGVRAEALDYVAFAEVDGGEIYLLGGMDDPDALRDGLYVMDYEEGEVRGVEVWDDGRGDWEAFAFLPGGSVLASGRGDLMREALLLRERGGSSMYDDHGDLVSSLRANVALRITRECGFDACIASGLSLRVDPETLATRFAMEFDSERDAARGLGSLVDDLDDTYGHYCDVAEVRQDGTLVTADVVCAMPLFEL